MASIDVYVVGDDRFDFTLWIDQALTWGDRGIKGVRDMVRMLERLCSNGDRVRQLTIVGHGDEYGQWVGQDLLIAEALPAWRMELGKMRPLFGRGGHVIMGGCRQGRNGGLLLALSDIWNVPVTGYTGLQRPLMPGYEGGETTCFLTCTRSGYTSIDRLDDVVLRIRQAVQ